MKAKYTFIIINHNIIKIKTAVTKTVVLVTVQTNQWKTRENKLLINPNIANWIWQRDKDNHNFREKKSSTNITGTTGHHIQKMNSRYLKIN